MLARLPDGSKSVALNAGEREPPPAFRFCREPRPRAGGGLSGPASRGRPPPRVLSGSRRREPPGAPEGALPPFRVFSSCRGADTKR